MGRTGSGQRSGGREVVWEGELGGLLSVCVRCRLGQTARRACGVLCWGGCGCSRWQGGCRVVAGCVLRGALQCLPPSGVGARPNGEGCSSVAGTVHRT